MSHRQAVKLNMDDLKRIAFWIVTFSCGLLAKSLPIIDMNDSNIELMREQVECPSDLTLYTPSNMKEQCISAALNCFMTELSGTVKEECKDPGEVINQAVEFLEHWIQTRSGNAAKKPSECVCEIWPQAPFGEFLNKMDSLLQRENTVALSYK